MKKTNERIHIQTLILIWLIVGMGCLYIFHMYILGNQTVAYFDYGTDGKDQYIMWYNGIVNSLRNGSFSAWDFRNGFGMNTMGHHLTEPFLIPVYVLGVLFGPEHLTYYMVWVEIIRILVSATVFYLFLSEFAFSERSKLLVSIVYAFNSYMMVWGQHYALGSAVVYYPVILLFIEHVWKKKRFGIGLCLITFLTLQSSFYQGYMCMLGGGIYVVIRVLMMEQAPIRERCKVFFLCAGSMVLGLLMSAVRFLPSAAAQVGSSGRLEPLAPLTERLFVPAVWPGYVLKTILYRLFSSCIQGNGNEAWVGYKNFYEAPELFFSTLFVILLIQYLFLLPRMKETKKKMLLQYLSVLLCAVSIVFMNVTTLFNGLYKPFFRHTFVLMPLFGLMCAKVLDYIFAKKKVSVIGLLIALLGIAGVYYKAYSILPEQQFKNNAVMLLITGIVMVVVLFLSCREKMADAQNWYLLLTMVVTLNIVSDSFLCYNYREALTKDHPVYYSETYHSDVDAALDYLEEYDPTFYRVEKDYFAAASCLDSLAQDYRPISAYNANQNANIKEFTAQLWPQLNHEKDIYHIQFQNAVWDTTLAALTDVKYLLSKSDQLNLKGFTKIQQIGEISIYQNEMADSLGKFFTETVTEAEFEAAKADLDLQKLLKEVLIVGDGKEADFAKADLNFYKKEVIHDILKSNIPDEVDTAELLDLELELDENAWNSVKDVILQFTIDAEKRTVVNVTLDEGYTHSFVENWIGSRDIHIEIPQGTKKIRLEITDPSGYVSLRDFIFYGSREEVSFQNGAQIVIDAPKKDSLLNGTIRAAEDGVVMLAIPVEKGWNIYVDGEKQDFFTGDFGFISFGIEAGEHTLQAVFTAPLLKEGIYISIISWIMFLAVCIAGSRKNKGVKR